MPIPLARGRTSNTAIVSKPKAPIADFFCPWKVEEDADETVSDIERWAIQKKKDVATYRQSGEIRPRNGREWEQYICVPHFYCSAIPNLSQYRHDSLHEHLTQKTDQSTKQRPSSSAEKQNDVSDIDQTANTSETPRPSVIRRHSSPAPPTHINQTKLNSLSRPVKLSLTSKTSGVVDDDEEDTINQSDIRYNWNRNELISTPIGIKSDNGQNGLQASGVQCSVGTSVKLSYTHCSRRLTPIKRMSLDHKRPPELSQGDHSGQHTPPVKPQHYMEPGFGKTTWRQLADCERRKSVLVKEISDLENAIKKSSRRDKNVIQHNKQSAEKDLTARTTSRSHTDELDFGGIEREARILLKQVEDILKIGGHSYFHEKYTTPAHIGPPPFHPIASRSPLQRARDNSRRQRYRSQDFTERRKGLPLPSRPEVNKVRRNSAYSRGSIRPISGVTC